MGFRIGFGVGPIRYSTSLSGGRRRRKSKKQQKPTDPRIMASGLTGGVVGLLIGIAGGSTGMITGAFFGTIIAAIAGAVVFGIRDGSKNRRLRAQMNTLTDARNDYTRKRQHATNSILRMMEREGWTVSGKCLTCGRTVMPGAKSHVCGFGNVVTMLMHGKAVIGRVRGRHDPLVLITSLTTGGNETVKGAERTEVEQATLTAFAEATARINALTEAS